MPRFTVKLETPRGPRYLEWSTIVDAPISWGMTLAEYKRYYRDKYGSEGARDLVQVLAEIDQQGTATRFETAEQLVTCNRAGLGGTELSLEQIISHYCTTPSKRTYKLYDKPPRGKSRR